MSYIKKLKLSKNFICLFNYTLAAITFALVVPHVKYFSKEDKKKVFVDYINGTQSKG